MECIVQNSMEARGNWWNEVETTVSYKAWARLSPTLTHVVTYELVTSGAEDDAMSAAHTSRLEKIELKPPRRNAQMPRYTMIRYVGESPKVVGAGGERKQYIHEVLH